MPFIPRIRSILVCAFLMAAGLPLAVFWLWPQTSLQAFQMDEVRNRQALLARNLATSMGDYHRDLVTALQSFAPLIADGRGEEVRTSLESLHFTRICVVQPETGAVLRSFLGERKGCPDWYSEPRRETFLDLAGTAGVGVSPVAFAVNGPPEIMLVTRAYDVLIVGTISTDFFRELRAAVDADGDGYTAIVDQTGHVLAHPVDGLQNVATDLADFPPVIEILAGNNGTQTYHSEQMKADMIAGYAMVEGPGWGVFLPQPITALQRAATKVQQEGLLVLSLALALSAIAGLLIARFISIQVSSIERTTREMANGDQTKRVALAGRGAPAIRELADLGASLNTMADDMATANENELRLRMSAQQAAAAKAEFLANMSGEIRTPLASMLDITESLGRDATNERQCKQLDTVTETGKSMLGILDDILEFSQLDNGALELKQEPLDLTKITLSVVRLLNASATQKGVELVTRVPAEDPWLVLGDAGRMRQLLLNLVGNAVKFTKSGHVFVDLQVIAADDESASVEITVSDTGIGISPERMDTIFRAFEPDETDIPVGAGLGLATCQRITSAMGGALTVESEVHVGSTFQFIAQMPLASGLGDRIPVGLGAFSPIRAMVLAANPVQRDTLAGYLQGFGLAEVEMIEPDPAIRIFEGQTSTSSSVDVVIYDPNGFEFSPSEIQALMVNQESSSKARLIVLTDTTEVIEGNAEFAQTIDKPVAPADLCAALLVHAERSLAIAPLGSVDGAGAHFVPKGLSFVKPPDDTSPKPVQLFTVSNIHPDPVADAAKAYDLPAIMNEHLIEADEFANRYSVNRARPVNEASAPISNPSDASRMAVLIGTDPRTQANVALVLDELNITIEAVPDELAALDVLALGRPLEAILIDFTAPEGDPLETLDVIKDAAEDSTGDDYMIIGLVDHDWETHERELRAAGFTHVLRKPVRNSILKRVFDAETPEQAPFIAEMA